MPDGRDRDPGHNERLNSVTGLPMPMRILCRLASGKCHPAARQEDHGRRSGLCGVGGTSGLVFVLPGAGLRGQRVIGERGAGVRDVRDDGVQRADVPAEGPAPVRGERDQRAQPGPPSAP